MTEPLLRVTALHKHFGGLTAVRDVTLDIAVGEVHAVIGPNGAGKSTLINLLSGELRPSTGSIRIGSTEIAGWSSDRIARCGVGRSYQRSNIFPRFTAIENCRLAAQARLRSSMRFFRPVSSFADLRDEAERALALAGLTDRCSVPAFALSHGDQRQLEIAMTLATRPQLLLLDEPLAGTGPQEAQTVVALLRRLRPDHAILLVEHDMDAVFSLADRITVMVDGGVIETGPPELVRRSVAVQSAYLGAEEGADA
jgi:branched-chain amino acid transport system ATP-binding protein